MSIDVYIQICTHGMNVKSPKHKDQGLDIMPVPINVEQPDQIVDTQPTQPPAFALPKRSICQLPLVLLKVSNTFINTVFDA